VAPRGKRQQRRAEQPHRRLLILADDEQVGAALLAEVHRDRVADRHRIAQPDHRRLARQRLPGQRLAQRRVLLYLAGDVALEAERGKLLLDVVRFAPRLAGDQSLVVIGQLHEGGGVLAEADRVDEGKAHLARRQGSKQPRRQRTHGVGRDEFGLIRRLKEQRALRTDHRQQRGELERVPVPLHSQLADAQRGGCVQAGDRLPGIPSGGVIPRTRGIAQPLRQRVVLGGQRVEDAGVGGQLLVAARGVMLLRLVCCWRTAAVGAFWRVVVASLAPAVVAIGQPLPEARLGDEVIQLAGEIVACWRRVGMRVKLQ
jgi:hypothetical protein